jgi:hypothetical protein
METQYEADIKAAHGGSGLRKIANSDLFPSVPASLDGFPIEVPPGHVKVAGQLFGLGYQKECKSRRWDNVLEKARPGTVIVACSELAGLYPMAPEWKAVLGIQG